MAKSTSLRWLIRVGAAVLLASLFSSNVRAEAGTDMSAILTKDDVRHLLVRTGIGAAPEDVLAFRGITRQAAVDHILAGFVREPEIPMPAWVNAPVPHFHAHRDMDDEARVRFNNDRDAELSQLRQWWIINMLETSSPQTERMVLFWHDVFATSYHDTARQSLAFARQNQTFRQLGMGSWEVLLKAMIRDPALLEFLDSGSNHKDSPNENLARELLELFILGEGNYDERDIKEAARSLTGHDTDRIHDLSFRLKTWMQDRGKKTLFGVTGNHDGDDLVEIALDQAAAAEFLLGRFWHAFVSDATPDQRWVERLAARFRASDYNINQLYRDMLESEAFWSDQNRASMIKSPIDIVAGTARSLEYPKSHWRRFARWQAEMGMDLFAPPNVSGWKEGSAFITPGHLLNRHRMLDDLIANPQSSEAIQQTQNMAGSSKSSSMMQNTSMQSADQAEVPDLQIRMAAEDYEGAARYQVSLYSAQTLLWQSDRRLFNGGHDTQMYGRIGNPSELSWQLEKIVAPADAIANTDHVKISYLNDVAGPGGDRNLYVDGVFIDAQWLPGNRAEQQSDCVPKLAANAWKMYCSGSLNFNLVAEKGGAADDLPAWRASAAHVQWANKNPRRKSLSVRLALDNLATPYADFHTLSFSIKAVPGQPIQLQLESFGCWPSCFSEWPDCAWTDENFTKARTLSYPWLAANDDLWQGSENEACHWNQITEAERALVATLWRSLPGLIDQLKSSNGGVRFSQQLDSMSTQLAARALLLADTPYVERGGLLQIEDKFAPKPQSKQSLSSPSPLVADIDSLLTQLATEKLSLERLLLPDLASAGIPGLPDNANSSAMEQLEALVKHPLFQMR